MTAHLGTFENNGPLSSTGMADAATLAARFGIDIHAMDFWRSSLDTIRQEITQFEGLVSARPGESADA
ncbi:MAG TPA: hypothetical protein VGP82_23160 [Ktedonobacterales bacterium]|nr:hypothetical protein [Ktedonobacterales bacterium]